MSKKHVVVLLFVVLVLGLIGLISVNDRLRYERLFRLSPRPEPPTAVASTLSEEVIPTSKEAPSGQKVIECEFFVLAPYLSDLEYSAYGREAVEWQTQGLVSKHYCGDWVLTTNPSQHRFLSRAFEARFGVKGPHAWYTNIAGYSYRDQSIRREDGYEIEATIRDGQRFTGKLLGLFVNGEEVFSGHEDNSVRELNPLEEWTLRWAEIESEYVYPDPVAFWFDTPLCLAGDCQSANIPDWAGSNLPGCRFNWLVLEFPPCWPEFLSAYTPEMWYMPAPPDMFARFSILLKVMQENNLFFNPWGFPECCYDSLRLLDAATGEYVESWYGPEEDKQPWGWRMLLRVPDSGRVALEMSSTASCVSSGEYRQENCVFERVFEGNVFPGWALSFGRDIEYGIEMRRVLSWQWQEWLFPVYWLTERIPVEVLAEYLPALPESQGEAPAQTTG